MTKENSMEELKLCPFCSNEIICNERNKAVCINISCPIYLIKFDITAWNTRADSWIKVTPETMPKQIETYDESDFVIITDGKSWTVATWHFPYGRWKKYNSPHDLNLADIIKWKPITLPEGGK